MANFSISHNLNTLFVKLEGKFDQSDGDQFVKVFQSEVSKIQPSNTELKFDAGDFQVLGAENQDGLKNCFELYKGIGFKKISMDLGKNAILGMQVKRLATAAGLMNFEIV